MSALTAALIVGAIGLFCGALLAVASVVFAVPVDETAQAVEELLPGANCGACGFSGCSGYASALSGGETTNTALCAPGGSEVSAAVASLLGLEAGEVEPQSAVVMCRGSRENASAKMTYDGVESCRLASQLFGGPKDCVYGCLGLGDCVRACPYHAIRICDGVARVNPALCRACRMCVSACPKGLIELMPLNKSKAAVLCKNKDKGVLARKECKAACIGCKKCEKACPSGAITVESFNAHADVKKCVGCGECRDACPVGCISILNLH